VILWAHDDAEGLPVAKTISIEVEGDSVVAEAQFDLDDTIAARLFHKVVGGFVNATSVRWLPLEHEIREVEVGGKLQKVVAFIRQELLEWSYVAIPADPGALVLRAATLEPICLDDYCEPESRALALNIDPEALAAREAALTAGEAALARNIEKATGAMRTFQESERRARAARVDHDCSASAIAELSRITGRSMETLRAHGLERVQRGF
jgi:hypothetical protein